MEKRIGIALLVLMLSSACGASKGRPVEGRVGAAGASLVTEAQRRLRAGDSLSAEQYFVAAWNAGQSRELFFDALLALCFRAGRLQSALAYVERALAELEEDRTLRELEVVLLAALGRGETALERARLLPLTRDVSPRFLFLRGSLEFRFGSRASAKAILEEYLAHGSSALRDREAKALLAILTAENARDQ